jgi:hypothetical protein
MDFLKNINKEFRLTDEYGFFKKTYHYLFKNSEDKIEPKDIIVLVDDINMRKVSLTFKSIGNIDEVVDQVANLMCKNLTEDADKFKVISNKVIEAWENTPKKFIQQKLSFSNETYKYIGLLNNEEYMLSVFALFGNISFHSNFRFSTGCGGDTYFGKDFFIQCLNEIDSWLSKTIKEINSAKIKNRIKNQILNKSKIEIPLSKIDTYLELVDNETHKDSVKPPFPIKFTDNQMNLFMGEFGECYIDEEIVEELMDQYGLDISNLLEWEVSYEHEGEHHNDGQICDYTITLTSPDGHEYYAYNSHSLVTGWNFYGDVVIW